MNLEHILRLRVELGEAYEIGDVGSGARRLSAIVGGAFEGPSLVGRVLAGGLDWQTLRSDGAVLIDAKYGLQTDEGSNIGIHVEGLRRLSPSAYFRGSVRFETATPHLSWLQDHLFVADGVKEESTVIHNVFRVD